MGISESKKLQPIKRKITEDYILSNEVLGVGISGKVLICQCKGDGKQYALKVLPNNVKSYREVDLHYRSCICPNVVQIKDVYEAKFNKKLSLLVVMELMQGGELFERVLERRNSTPYTEKEVVKLVRQICTAIAYLHSLNIAHRDLKPENLLFTDKSPDAKLKLTDFGFAKEISSAHSLLTPCYTPYYVAPEVLSEGRYDKSCDIWSLGVITYILLCGYPPFYSSRGAPISPGMKARIRSGKYTFPESEWKNISLEAKDLIKRLLKTDPQQRLTIEEVIRHSWIVKHTEAPDVPLSTTQILSQEENNLIEAQNELTLSLAAMRVDSDGVVLKSVCEADNPLLRKRRNMKTPNLPNVLEAANKI